MPKTIELDPARIPEVARRFVAPCTLAKSADKADAVDVHIAARSEQPLDHWYWGQCVHDLDGMQTHKERLALDYVHDDEQILGYLDTFEHRDGALWADGKLLLSSERAREVLANAQNGVPYEASIAFDLDGLVTEFVQQNAETEVNGQKMTGPLLVFREWNLRGVAICPHGYDKHTLTQFCQQNPGAKFTPPEDATIDETPDAEEPDAESDDATDGSDPPPVAEASTDEPTPQAEEVDDPDPETPDPAAPADDAETPDPAAQRAAEGAAFVAEFGEDRGPRYFTRGLSLDAARAEYTRELAEENASLRERLGAIGDRLGDTTPAEFQDGEPESQQRTRSGRDAKQLRNALPERLADFAMGLRFAGQN